MENKKELNEDLIYIKSFTNISVKKVCKRLGIDDSNVLKGKTTDANLKRVRHILESDIKALSKRSITHENNTL